VVPCSECGCGVIAEWGYSCGDGGWYQEPI